MACTPHPQVMSPCSDDAVSVGQILGTSGDVSFDERGSVALEIGQTDAEIEFTYQKETSDYRFEYLYIKTEDATPGDLRPVVNEQTTRGFTVQLTGTPVTANSVLYWRVVVPDNLHTCQTAGGGVKYILASESQSGIETFLQGQNSVTVVFDTPQPDSAWKFDSLTVEATSISDPMTFSMPTVAAKTASGFKLIFQGSPDEAGYTVHWSIS